MILEAVMTQKLFRVWIKDNLAVVLWHSGANMPVAVACLLSALAPMHAALHIL